MEFMGEKDTPLMKGNSLTCTAATSGPKEIDLRVYLPSMRSPPVGSMSMDEVLRDLRELHSELYRQYESNTSSSGNLASSSRDKPPATSPPRHLAVQGSAAAESSPDSLDPVPTLPDLSSFPNSSPPSPPQANVSIAPPSSSSSSSASSANGPASLSPSSRARGRTVYPWSSRSRLPDAVDHDQQAWTDDAAHAPPPPRITVGNSGGEWHWENGAQAQPTQSFSKSPMRNTVSSPVMDGGATPSPSWQSFSRNDSIRTHRKPSATVALPGRAPSVTSSSLLERQGSNIRLPMPGPTDLGFSQVDEMGWEHFYDIIVRQLDHQEERLDRMANQFQEQVEEVRKYSNLLGIFIERLSQVEKKLPGFEQRLKSVEKFSKTESSYLREQISLNGVRSKGSGQRPNTCLRLSQDVASMFLVGLITLMSPFNSLLGLLYAWLANFWPGKREEHSHHHHDAYHPSTMGDSRTMDGPALNGRGGPLGPADRPELDGLRMRRTSGRDSPGSRPNMYMPSPRPGGIVVGMPPKFAMHLPAGEHRGGRDGPVGGGGLGGRNKKGSGELGNAQYHAAAARGRGPAGLVVEPAGYGGGRTVRRTSGSSTGSSNA
eukprot:g51956.t1